MNKSVLLSILLLFCSASITIGQIQVNSKIIDKKTGKAIPYANISVENTTKGTMSNLEGNFQLYINVSGLNTRVIVSSLGYESISIHPKKIGKAVELSPVLYEISEIKVSASKLMSDPKKIFKECMKAAPGFRPEEAYINKGFLRQTSLLNKKYVKLIEAALFTYTTPEDPKFKVHILEKRNTFDNREIDGKNLYFFKLWKKHRYKKANKISENYQPGDEELIKLIQETDEERNSVEKLRRLNTAYQPKIGDMWHDLKKIYNSKFHQIKLDTILDMNGEAMYKLKILPTAKQLQNSSSIMLGHLLISANDYALHELKIGRVKNPKIQTRIYMSYNYIVKYKKHKGKLYPYYLKSFGRDFAGFTESWYDQKKKRKTPHLIKEFLFTEIVDDANEIAGMLPDQWNNKLYIPTEYHPEFWKNYTILLETKNEEKLRQDLEQEISMKEQFQHSSDSIRIKRFNETSAK
jgi:hypothetical protein